MPRVFDTAPLIDLEDNVQSTGPAALKPITPSTAGATGMMPREH